jgi:MoaA/NifB/PqqE/SkfB family radical SAM enzyme
MNDFNLVDTARTKKLFSLDYNFEFNKVSGFFARWGERKDSKDDPSFSPYGPEILDLECSTICNGVPDATGKVIPCSYCYKENTGKGKNMSLETFKKVFKNINPHNVLTQIAFGLDATAEANPEFWDMCEYTRSQGVIPNGTVANISDETADKIAKYFGACAVSYHGNKDICYNSVEKLSNRGMQQVNIHHVIHQDNYDETLEIISDISNDPRLRRLNALVLLSLKNKGRAKTGFKPLEQDKFNVLVQKLILKNVSFGFDSCTAHKFMEAIQDNPLKQIYDMMVEPCESTLFSSYVNVEGKFFPCSFAETGKGIDLTKDDCNFLEIWNNNPFRKRLWDNNRKCPLYDI